MIQFLTLLSYVPGFARIGLLLIVCFLLYRRFSLPTLPWLAAHYAIIGIFNIFAGQFFDALRNFVQGTIHVSSTLSYVGVGAILLAGIIKFLVTLLILSEIIYFVYAHCPDVQSKFLARLVLVRTHVTALGITLVALALVKPATWLLIWICHHSSTAVSPL